mmetsp:Transcript_57824/g.102711  ORF Transcript_57824/g.102711 Transcript_57824/m.102711 type:complete len:219 (+) Transcript_57824:80-736(+)
MAGTLYGQKKEYRFLGILTHEQCMLCVCSFNAAICVFCLGTVSPEIDLKFAGVTVGTGFQMCVGAWALIGIFAITSGLIGFAQERVFPLAVYFWYLVATTVLMVLFLFFLVKKSATECVFVHEGFQTQRVGNNFSCTLWSFAVLVAAMGITACMCFALWAVSRVKDKTGLHVDESIGESAALLLRQKGAQSAPRNASLPAEGVQHPWGSRSYKQAEFS